MTTRVREAPDERKVVVLSLSGGKDGEILLFEPRLISAGGIELKFSGYECDEFCWVIQEWVCELQPEAAVDDAAFRVGYGLPPYPLPR